MNERLSWSQLPFWTQALIVTLISLVMGLASLWAATRLEDPYKAILQNVGGIALTSGFFSWWGAAYAKIEVTRYLHSSLGLSREIQDSGIISVGKWPISIPVNARKVDMIAIRGHAWFTMQSTALASILKNDNCEVRICFVHPKSPVIPVLASKFGESEDEVSSKVIDSILSVVGLAELAKKDKASGRLTVRGHCLLPAHTYYRFDEKCWIVWYGLRRGRLDVPLLQLGNGSLKIFFQDDFERFWSERDTYQIYDSTADDSDNLKSLESLGVQRAKLQRILGISSIGS
jgi:hypothetical protein